MSSSKRQWLSLDTDLFSSLAGQEDRMKDATISVLLKCLSYDFAGTNLDDAGEDIGTVQVMLRGYREDIDMETLIRIVTQNIDSRSMASHL